MMMPGREYQAQPSRFGFNGKENDNEVKGFGNQQDYGMRIYDTRLGKFLSIDPISKEFPWNSVYAFAENSPIENIDLDGLERAPSTRGSNRFGVGGGLFTGWGRERAAEFNEAMISTSYIRREREARTRLFEEIRTRARETRNGTREGMEGFRNGIRKYLNEAMSSAALLYNNDKSVSISRNQFNSSVFEKEVTKALIENPTYVRVIRQVTFVVESSKGNSIRIRVDNVGVRNDGGLDLIEAKFSIYEITQNSVARSLTVNQKEFFTMMINGDVASITFVGGPAKAAVLGSVSGTNVLGKIKDIKIIPSSTNGSSNAQQNPKADESSTQTLPSTLPTKIKTN